MFSRVQHFYGDESTSGGKHNLLLWRFLPTGIAKVALSYFYFRRFGLGLQLALVKFNAIQYV